MDFRALEPSCGDVETKGMTQAMIFVPSVFQFSNQPQHPWTERQTLVHRKGFIILAQYGGGKNNKWNEKCPRETKIRARVRRMRMRR